MSLPSPPSPGTGRITLQTLALPEPAICSEMRLYLRRDPGVQIDTDAGECRFLEGAACDFGSYVGSFDLGLWSRETHLAGLALRLDGRGRFRVRLILRTGPHEARTLMDESRALDAAPAPIAIAPLLDLDPDAPLPETRGLLQLQLTAEEDGAVFSGGAWDAAAGSARPVSLGIVITTFRREDAVADTARRLMRFLDAHPDLGAEVALLVVDNGRTLALPDHPRCRVLANPNLGGAGGFARGLAEARARGFSHALFMDDDARFGMENLIRTLAFLRLAKAENAAVSGAMISEARPFAMWEMGSVFDGACRPRFVGVDLREPARVTTMLLAASAGQPAHFYAGWWFFAFPVAAVTHDPFPFFVRGDDISFSLANDFRTVSLPGVMSLQEDFSSKESPLTLYLDLRNHLHHHLVQPGLERGRLGTIKVAAWFVLRSIIRMHYNSAAAQLEAWKDVMKGPDFFEENADMATRRPEITALFGDEAWAPAPEGAQPPGPLEPIGGLFAQAMKFTLNGHLLPAYGAFGSSRAIPPGDRGLLWPLWGAREATFWDHSGTRTYTVRHSKARAAWIALRFAWLALRWSVAFSRLRKAHRAGYDRMTTPGWWQTRFGPPAA